MSAFWCFLGLGFNKITKSGDRCFCFCCFPLKKKWRHMIFSRFSTFNPRIWKCLFFVLLFFSHKGYRFGDSCFLFLVFFRWKVWRSFFFQSFFRLKKKSVNKLVMHAIWISCFSPPIPKNELHIFCYPDKNKYRVMHDSFWFVGFSKKDDAPFGV